MSGAKPGDREEGRASTTRVRRRIVSTDNRRRHIRERLYGLDSPHGTLDLQHQRAVVGSEQIGEWARLFLAPGMGHCGGGEGPNVFDPMAALEQWVEQGRAP